MLFRSKNITPEAKFWNWFSKNSQKLLHIEGIELLNAVSTEVQKYNKDIIITMSYGPLRPRELIISAGGDFSLVHIVETLCDASPEIPDWKVIRFRPRFEGGSHGIESDGVKIDTDGIQFVAYHDETKIGVEIYAHWRKPEDGDRTDALTFLMLDHTIGEYEVMCGIGFIEVHPLENAPENARPWNEFAEMFDANWVREQ